jgi:hypothetical protein
MYALDGAAGLPKHDPGYRAWLFGDDEPKWLATYAKRRDSWTRPWHDDAGGGASEFDTCGWTTETFDELRACLEEVVPSEDLPTLSVALSDTHAHLSAKWPLIEERLKKLGVELTAALATEPALDLVRKLRREASLADETELRFSLVLVGKPPGSHSYARQMGAHLVHEVSPSETSGGLLGVAFHEMAHLAHRMSPERPALEAAFVLLGDSGRLAGNAWDEVVATAFGNGLAAEAFDPAFRVSGSFYDDELLDALGRALYLEWRAGQEVRLGAPLAARLTRLVDANGWAERSPVGRYLWYLVVTAERSSTLAKALDGIDTRSAYRSRPIDDTMSARVGLPPWAPRVVLATVDELAAHPALVARTEIPEKSWTSALLGHRAAAFRRTDASGALMFVIVANDATALESAMPEFAALPRMVPEGWTSW